MAAATGRLDPSNWTHGEPSLFSALGFKQPFTYPHVDTSVTQEAAAADAAKGTSSTGSSGSTSAPTSSGPCNSATTTANQKLGQQLAASYGWGSGSQWTALNNVVMKESGWCNTIQNPSSTAYGIGQFLNTTWATVGGTKTSSAETQIKLMLLYIQQRYGTPEAAWAHEQKYGNY
jgi:hypothetical protein